MCLSIPYYFKSGIFSPFKTINVPGWMIAIFFTFNGDIAPGNLSPAWTIALVTSQACLFGKSGWTNSTKSPKIYKICAFADPYFLNGENIPELK